MSLRSAVAIGIGGIFLMSPSLQAKDNEDNGEQSFFLDYNVMIVNDDMGVMKTENYEPTASTKVSNLTYLGFQGTKGKKVSYRAYVRLTDDDMTIEDVEEAHLTYSINKMIDVTVGRQYLKQGGLDNKNDTYNADLTSAYVENNMPLPLTDNAVTVGLNFGKNTVSLQATNDIDGTCEAGETACFYNATQKQPAFLLEYAGDFGVVKPLLQITSYDGLNNSRAFSLGLEFKMKGLRGFVDYTSDSRNKKVLATDKETTTKYTSYALDISYDVGKFVPFVKIVSMDVEQDGTDSEINSALGTYDDNQTGYVFGVNLEMFNEAFIPYLAVRMIRGDFQDEDVDISVKEKAETKTNTEVILGFEGSV